MSFLPADYVAPKTTGGYFKPSETKTKIRVIAPAIVGYIDRDKSGDKPKPIRTKEKKAPIGEDYPKHFWAFPIWNYESNAVEIRDVSQATVRDQITALVMSEWWDPMDYDIVVSKTGKMMETKYFVGTTPAGKTELSDEIKLKVKETPVNLEALYLWEDPFEKVDTNDTPF